MTVFNVVHSYHVIRSKITMLVPRSPLLAATVMRAEVRGI